jgi:hypothetical protein
MDIPEWAKEGLPETLHNVPFLKDTENLEQFTERLSAAADHMGNSMRIPGPDATEEAWNEFNTKLQAKVPGLAKVDLNTPEGKLDLIMQMGLPDSPDGYGAEGEGAWLAEVAHKAAMTKEQFEALVKGVSERNVTAKTEMTAEHQQALEALDQEWGLAAVKKRDQIAGLLKLTGAPESMINSMTEKSMDVNTMRWLDSMADKFSDASNFVKDRSDPQGISPLEAQQQIQELLANPEYMKPGPIGQQLQKRMLELQRAANPSASQDINDLRSTDLGNVLDNFG